MQETQKFRAQLLERLSEDKDEFGDELHAVIDVCAQVSLSLSFQLIKMYDDGVKGFL